MSTYILVGKKSWFALLSDSQKLQHVHIVPCLSTGAVKQEVYHDKFAELEGREIDMSVTSRGTALSVAAKSKGLLQFEIK